MEDTASIIIIGRFDGWSRHSYPEIFYKEDCYVWKIDLSHFFNPCAEHSG